MAVEKDSLRVDYSPPSGEEDDDLGAYIVRPQDADSPTVTVVIGERGISAGLSLLGEGAEDEAVSFEDIRSSHDFAADPERRSEVARAIAVAAMEILNLQQR